MATFSPVQHAHTLNGSLMAGRHAKLALPALKTHPLFVFNPCIERTHTKGI